MNKKKSNTFEQRKNRAATVLLSLLLVTAALFAVLCLSGCSKNQESIEGFNPDLSDLEGKTIGVVKAKGADYLLSEYDNLDILRYDALSNLVIGLRYGQIDVAVTDCASANYVLRSTEGLKISETPVCDDSLAYLGNTLYSREILEELDEWIENEWNGSEEQADLIKRMNDKDGYVPKLPDVPEGGKVIDIMYDGAGYPFEYIDTDEKAKGIELEPLCYFAAEKGYTINWIEGEENSMLASSGNGDALLLLLGDTEVFRRDVKKRGEPFRFSKAYLPCGLVTIQVEDRSKMKVINTI